MTPDMALAAVALRGEKDVHALVVRAGEDAFAVRAQLDARWKARSGEPS